jgi:DNA primase
MLEAITERINELTKFEIYEILVTLGVKVSKVHSNKIICNCPYHNDKNPSLSMSLSPNLKGVFNCYSCPAKGNLWTLIKDFSNSPYEVLGIDKTSIKKYNHNLIFNKTLRNYNNKELKKEPVKSFKDIEKEKLDLEFFNSITAKIFHPFDIQECREYCISRLIDRGDIENHGIGYIDQGYVGISEFKKRLIIPIKDRDGKIVSVEGRDVTRSQEKKCIYPKNSKIGLSIFDYNNLDPEKTTIFVEGVMDVLRVKKVVPNLQVTTYFGIMLSKKQIEIVKTFKDVILMMDSDRGGREGINNFMKIYENDFYIAMLEKGDPGESSEDEILKALSNKKVISEFLLNESGFFKQENINW